MIQFNAIKLHDLVYLDSEGIAPDWFLVTGVSQKVGFFTATQLGYDIRPVMVPSDRMGIVRKHIRAAAVPGAIDALRSLCEEAKNNIDVFEGSVFYRRLEEAEDALRAVRGEETK